MKKNIEKEENFSKIIDAVIEFWKHSEKKVNYQISTNKSMKKIKCY